MRADCARLEIDQRQLARGVGVALECSQDVCAGVFRSEG